jgi:monoamine oxidase
MLEREVDVVIVGAGLAGLYAARCLTRAGKRVVVLEARSEVGGRTRTRLVDGEIADFGAEWIGHAHRRAHALVRELNLSTEPAENLGGRCLWRLPSGDSVGRLPPVRTWQSFIRLYVAALRRGRGIRTESPWSAARAAELDDMSVATWLDTLHLDSDARYVVERLIGALTGPDLHRLSLLHLLWLFRLAGGPVRTLVTTFQWRLREGAQALSRGMADGLGDSVELDAVVQHLSQDEAGVTVSLREGTSYRASHAIVAVPVSHLRDIEMDPPLPEDQIRVSNLEIAAASKVIGLLPSGHQVRHTTVIGGDHVWAAWRRGNRVTGFVPASRDAEDRVVQADLAAAFGIEPEALRATSVHRWADEVHIGGCDAAFAPGEVCGFGPALAKAHGRVQFAGAERSSWPDNMEGALESGGRSAERIIASVA